MLIPKSLAKRTPSAKDAGIVQFHHWGVNAKDQIVFEGDRRVLIKRRSHWAA